jgi:hypothetical protein
MVANRSPAAERRLSAWRVCSRQRFQGACCQPQPSALTLACRAVILQRVLGFAECLQHGLPVLQFNLLHGRLGRTLIGRQPAGFENRRGQS